MKLEDIPLSVPHLKGSKAYGYEDYKFGWYMKLLIESADSANPGYLPNDVGELWKLAGAMTRGFFEKWGGLKVIDEHFNRTEDGRWIYNRRLLDIMRGESQVADNKAQAKPEKRIKYPIVFSLSSHEYLIFKSYPRKEGKQYALKCIHKLIKHLPGKSVTFIDRFGNEMTVKLADDIAVAKFLHDAVIEFASSPAGSKVGAHGEDLRPHPSTWMNQGRYADDRREWYREAHGKATARLRNNLETLSRITTMAPATDGEVYGDVLPRGDTRADASAVFAGVAGNGRRVRGAGLRAASDGIHEVVQVLPTTSGAKGDE